MKLSSKGENNAACLHINYSILISPASQDSGIYSERASRASENLENVLQEPSKVIHKTITKS